MIDPWIWALGAVIVGLLSGVVGAALVRAAVSKGREERPEVQDAARAASTFVFLFFCAVGGVVAVGVTSPETLRPIPADVLSYSPHVLAAGLILIAGRALAFAAAGYVKRSLGGASSRIRLQLAESLRLLVTAAAMVLALRQLGIDTTILNILVGAIMFGVAAGFALLVGLGGRDLSRELAFGRYLSRIVRPGDELAVGDVCGVVVAMHPASVEVLVDSGASVHLANSQVFRDVPRVHR
jgi:hypothetical protein